ncbi:hypothetical protein FRC19_006883 [Serendipita sp. 401]|nr:hypothetical protein FRC19_006883 [Serendipita sp. 401]
MSWMRLGVRQNGSKSWTATVQSPSFSTVTTIIFRNTLDPPTFSSPTYIPSASMRLILPSIIRLVHLPLECAVVTNAKGEESKMFLQERSV